MRVTTLHGSAPWFYNISTSTGNGSPTAGRFQLISVSSVGWCTRLLVSNSRERPTKIKCSLPHHRRGWSLATFGWTHCYYSSIYQFKFLYGVLAEESFNLGPSVLRVFPPSSCNYCSRMQASDTAGTSAFVLEVTVVRRRPFAQLCVYCQKVFDNWAVVVHTLQKESKSESLPSYEDHGIKWRDYRAFGPLASPRAQFRGLRPQ
jgi:hypothetical protein